MYIHICISVFLMTIHGAMTKCMASCLDPSSCQGVRSSNSSAHVRIQSLASSYNGKVVSNKHSLLVIYEHTRYDKPDICTSQFFKRTNLLTSNYSCRSSTYLVLSIPTYCIANCSIVPE